MVTITAHRSRLAKVSAALILSLLIAACNTAKPAPEPASPTPPVSSKEPAPAAPPPKQLGSVKIGMSTSASWIPIQVAAKQGFFQKNGVDAKIQVLSSAPDTIKALVAGDLNFGALAIERSITTTQQGKPIVSVMSIQDTPPTTILVSADSNLKPGDFAALKGKTAGIVLGGWSELVLRTMLKRHGMKWEDIKTVSTPNPTTMFSALKSKQVEILSAIEPTQSTGIVQNMVKVFFDLEDPQTLKAEWPQPFVATTLQTSKEYAAAHPELVAAVVKSVQEGLQYVREHTDEVAATWAADNPNQPKEVWETTIKRLLNIWSQDGAITPDAFKNVQEILLENGVLTKASKFEDMVYKTK